MIQSNIGSWNVLLNFALGAGAMSSLNTFQAGIRRMSDLHRTFEKLTGVQHRRHQYQVIERLEKQHQARMQGFQRYRLQREAIYQRHFDRLQTMAAAARASGRTGLAQTFEGMASRRMSRLGRFQAGAAAQESVLDGQAASMRAVRGAAAMRLAGASAGGVGIGVGVGAVALAGAAVQANNAATKQKVSYLDVAKSVEQANKAHESSLVILRSTTMSYEESADAAREYIKILDNGSVSAVKFGKNVETLARTTGKSAKEIAAALGQAISSGNIGALQGVSGLSWERVSNINRSLGAPTNLLTAHGRQGAISRALSVQESGRAALNQDSAGYAASQVLNQVKAIYKSGMENVGKSVSKGLMYAVTTSEQRKRVTQAAEANKPRAEAQQFVEQFTSSVQALQDTQQELDTVRQRWQAIRYEVIKYREQVEDIEATTKGSHFGTDTMLGTYHRAVRGLAVGNEAMQKGVRYNPEKAFEAYSGSFGAATDVAGRMKQITERLSGRNEFGLYTGSHATGREYWLLSQEMRKRKTGLMEEMKNADTNGELAPYRKQLGQAQSPQQILEAVNKYQAFLAEKAKAAQEELAKKQGAAADATEKAFTLLKANLAEQQKVFAGIEATLQNLSKGAKIIVTQDPEFQKQVEQLRASAVDVANSLGKDFLPRFEKAVTDLRNSIPANAGVASPKGSLVPDTNITDLTGTQVSIGVGKLVNAATPAGMATIVWSALAQIARSASQRPNDHG